MSARRERRPVECALCGMPRWNDSGVMWLGPTWDDRQPYCAEDCAVTIVRQLLEAAS